MEDEDWSMEDCSLGEGVLLDRKEDRLRVGEGVVLKERGGIGLMPGEGGSSGSLSSTYDVLGALDMAEVY